MNTVKLFFFIAIASQGHSLHQTVLNMNPKIIKISENVWRTAAKNHKQKIKQLLQPGLLPMGDQSISKRRGRDNNNNKSHDDWTALDPINPVYNFLIEYYGIKGAKGPRRLSKWAPDPKLLLDSESETSLKSGNLNDIDEVYEACMKASNGLGGKEISYNLIIY